MILRPSKAATWVKCHGNPSLSEHFPCYDADDSDAAVREEGTACHWAAYQHAASGQRVPVGTLAPNGVAITSEMHDAHDLYFQAVAQWGVLPNGTYRYELPVKATRIHPNVEGTCDVGAYNPVTKTIYIGDLKYGYKYVPVINNWQLICYAVGLQEYYGIESDNDLYYEFLIVQPRAADPVRRWRCHATFLRGHINQLTNAANAATGPNPLCTVNPGCLDCEGASICSTVQSAALGALDTSLEATPHGLPFSHAEWELRKLQYARDVIDARITGLEGQIMHGLRSGQSSRFFAMEQGLGRKTWRDPDTVAAIARLMGVNIYKPSDLITPTQAEKLLPAGIIDQHSQRKPGSTKLVPIESSKIGRKLGLL